MKLVVILLLFPCLINLISCEDPPCFSNLCSVSITPNFTCKKSLHDIKSLTITNPNSNDSIPDTVGKCYPNVETLTIVNVGPAFVKVKNFVNLIKLHLQNNKLESLHSGIFSESFKLEVIDVSNNSIHTIDPKVFNGLKNLKVLYLSGNKIATIDDDLFKDNENLETISLDGNKFTKINWGIFKPLNKLAFLRIFDTKWMSSENGYENDSLNNFIEVFKEKTFKTVEVTTITTSKPNDPINLHQESSTEAPSTLVILLGAVILVQFVLILAILYRGRMTTYKFDEPHAVNKLPEIIINDYDTNNQSMNMAYVNHDGDPYSEIDGVYDTIQSDEKRTVENEMPIYAVVNKPKKTKNGK